MDDEDLAYEPGDPKAPGYTDRLIDRADLAPDFSIAETCCGKCPGATCYVDYLTGERA